MSSSSSSYNRERRGRSLSPRLRHRHYPAPPPPPPPPVFYYMNPYPGPPPPPVPVNPTYPSKPLVVNQISLSVVRRGLEEAVAEHERLQRERDRLIKELSSNALAIDAAVNRRVYFSRELERNHHGGSGGGGNGGANGGGNGGNANTSSGSLSGRGNALPRKTFLRHQPEVSAAAKEKDVSVEAPPVPLEKTTSEANTSTKELSPDPAPETPRPRGLSAVAASSGDVISSYILSPGKPTTAWSPEPSPVPSPSATVVTRLANHIKRPASSEPAPVPAQTPSVPVGPQPAFSEHHAMLRLLYRRYCIYGTGAVDRLSTASELTLSLHQFMAFAKDHDLVRDVADRETIARIFTRANWEGSPSRGERLFKVDDNPDRGLNFTEFKDALLRIATEVLHVSPQELIDKLLLRAPLEDGSAQFRADLAHSSVRAALARHAKTTAAAFRAYCPRTSTTMPVSNFVALARDLKLAGKALSVHSILAVFVASLDIDDQALTEQAWVESLCRLALAYVPGDEAGLGERIDKFLGFFASRFDQAMRAGSKVGSPKKK
jgi:hypothetical protein